MRENKYYTIKRLVDNPRYSSEDTFNQISGKEWTDGPLREMGLGTFILRLIYNRTIYVGDLYDKKNKILENLRNVLSSGDIKAFKQVLKAIKHSTDPQGRSNVKKLRILGDVFDPNLESENQNIQTLLLLKALDEKEIDFTITMSENDIKFYIALLQDKEGIYKEYKEAFLDLYKKHFKLLDYRLTTSKVDKSSFDAYLGINIFAHQKFTTDKIRWLYDELRTDPYGYPQSADETASNYVDMIDSINRNFYRILHNEDFTFEKLKNQRETTNFIMGGGDKKYPFTKSNYHVTPHGEQWRVDNHGGQVDLVYKSRFDNNQAEWSGDLDIILDEQLLAYEFLGDAKALNPEEGGYVPKFKKTKAERAELLFKAHNADELRDKLKDFFKFVSAQKFTNIVDPAATGRTVLALLNDPYYATLRKFIRGGESTEPFPEHEFIGIDQNTYLALQLMETVLKSVTYRGKDKKMKAIHNDLLKSYKNGEKPIITQKQLVDFMKAATERTGKEKVRPTETLMRIMEEIKSEKYLPLRNLLNAPEEDMATIPVYKIMGYENEEKYLALWLMEDVLEALTSKTIKDKGKIKVLTNIYEALKNTNDETAPKVQLGQFIDQLAPVHAKGKMPDTVKRLITTLNKPSFEDLRTMITMQNPLTQDDISAFIKREKLKGQQSTSTQKKLSEKRLEELFGNADESPPHPKQYSFFSRRGQKKQEPRELAEFVATSQENPTYDSLIAFKDLLLKDKFNTEDLESIFTDATSDMGDDDMKDKLIDFITKFLRPWSIIDRPPGNAPEELSTIIEQLNTEPYLLRQLLRDPTPEDEPIDKPIDEHELEELIQEHVHQKPSQFDVAKLKK